MTMTRRRPPSLPISATAETAESVKAELPLVAAARERDRLARERLARGGDPYEPTEADLLEARAWKCRGRT